MNNRPFSHRMRGRVFLFSIKLYHSREDNTMTIYDELVARGLIAQVTDEAEIRDLINNGKATFYIGFDQIGRAHV